MKDYVTSPERVVYLKDIKALAGISGDAKAGGLTIGAGTRLADIVASTEIREALPRALAGDARGRHAADPQHGHRRRQPAPAAALLVLPRRLRPARHERRQEPGPRRRQPLPRDLHDRRRRPVRQPVEPGRRPDRPGRPGDDHRAQGERTVKVEELYQVPKSETDSELTIAARRGPHQGDDPGGQGQERLVRGPAEAGAGLAAGAGLGQSDDGRRHRLAPPGSSSTAWRRSPGGATRPRRRSPASASSIETAAAAGEAAAEGAAPLSMNGYKVPLTKTVVKRALLAAVGNRYWEEA